ncbi:NUDIX domain-containing protein, partial [Streptomyces sp. NPDC057746]|uniref:NUDIX domain-containing protein n=1 Tax=Streptomyces sp. NPDC057746 TaxID=3346237 RepID=UPI0036A45334
RPTPGNDQHQLTARGPLFIRCQRSTIQPLPTDVWQWAGGNLERGETPWDGARRECLEETGINFQGVQRLLGVHFVPQREHWPANHIGFIFDGGELGDAQLARVRLTDEHTEWRVATVDEWRGEMTPVNFKRLEAIHTARETGTVAYLEGL